MATIDFPNSPNDGQTYTFANRTWTFNFSANAWIATTSNVGYTGSQGYQGYTGSSGAAAAIGYTGSTGPAGLGYTGSSGAAAAIGYTGSAGAGGGGSTVTMSVTAPTSPTDGSLWFNPSINTLSIYEVSLSAWVIVSTGNQVDNGLVTSDPTVYDDYGSIT
jgi:hypothetical protein